MITSCLKPGSDMLENPSILSDLNSDQMTPKRIRSEDEQNNDSKKSRDSLPSAPAPAPGPKSESHLPMEKKDAGNIPVKRYVPPCPICHVPNGTCPHYKIGSYGRGPYLIHCIECGDSGYHEYENCPHRGELRFCYCDRCDTRGEHRPKDCPRPRPLSFVYMRDLSEEETYI